MQPIAAICPVVFALAMPCAAYAADQRPLTIELKAGAEYDSNVSVEQTDVVTRTGDAALKLGGAVKYRFADFGKTQLTAGYDFDQTVYDDLTDYNLQIHTLSAGSSTRIGKASVGADYRFFHIRLGAQPFLDMHVASPSVAGFVSSNVFLRASYTYSHKAFTTASTLDADTHDLEANAYYFIMRRRGFVGLAVRYQHENTVDPTRDYDAMQVTGSLQLPVNVPAKGSKIRLGLAYRDRDYSNVTPSLGTPRREKRYSFSASADIPVGRGFSIKPEFRAMDRNSNDPYTNYADQMSALSMVYRY